MADEVVATDVKGEIAPDKGVGEKEVAVDENSKPVTMGELKRMLNPLFAEKRIKDKEVKSEVKAEVKAEVKEVKSEADATIQTRLQALEDARTKLNQSRKRDAIERAASDAGVGKEHLKLFRTAFESEYGSKLDVDDEGVFYREIPEDSPKGVDSVVKDFLKADGAIFKSAIQTPGLKGLKSGNAGRTLGQDRNFFEMNVDERLKATAPAAGAKMDITQQLVQLAKGISSSNQ